MTEQQLSRGKEIEYEISDLKSAIINLNSERVELIRERCGNTKNANSFLSALISESKNQMTRLIQDKISDLEAEFGLL